MEKAKTTVTLKNKVFFGDMCREKYTYAVRECRVSGARCECPNRPSPESRSFWAGA